VYDSDDLMDHFAKFASIYRELASYRKELMQEASTEGIPMIR
jgi:hypothetical protein